MKITNKEALRNLLEENLIDESRAGVFSEVACILSNEEFEEFYEECRETEEEYMDETGVSCFTLWRDMNVYCVVEELCLFPDEVIKDNFGSFYNNATIAVNEDGEGFVFFEALWG